ncbi:transmembrane protein, putative [Medicago truncatula]|uniref:Transmembrane protein, putative n=1 Tax=Medicago truncatula TaxID=3880 RepID=A0A072VML4_MEDTR|nr:transmembrane protein, putative [Medicago truncatula]
MVSALILRLVPRLIIHWFLAFQLSYQRNHLIVVETSGNVNVLYERIRDTLSLIVPSHVIAIQRVHPYGHVYVIQMDFLKWQQEAIILIALLPATVSGVSFLLPFFYHLESSLVDASEKLT